MLHLSWLKACVFFSLQNITCSETQQLNLVIGNAGDEAVSQMLKLLHTTQLYDEQLNQGQLLMLRPAFNVLKKTLTWCQK